MIGGLYVWQTKVKDIKAKQQQAQMQAAAINAANMNELKTLEQDLNSVDVSTGVDAEAIK